MNFLSSSLQQIILFKSFRKFSQYPFSFNHLEQVLKYDHQPEDESNIILFFLETGKVLSNLERNAYYSKSEVMLNGTVKIGSSIEFVIFGDDSMFE
jgi:hypothetical protein